MAVTSLRRKMVRQAELEGQSAARNPATGATNSVCARVSSPRKRGPIVPQTVSLWNTDPRLRGDDTVVGLVGA
jgi:hypothetical protein